MLWFLLTLLRSGAQAQGCGRRVLYVRACAGAVRPGPRLEHLASPIHPGQLTYTYNSREKLDHVCCTVVDDIVEKANHSEHPPPMIAHVLVRKSAVASYSPLIEYESGDMSYVKLSVGWPPVSRMTSDVECTYPAAPSASSTQREKRVWHLMLVHFELLAPPRGHEGVHHLPAPPLSNRDDSLE